MNIIICDDRIDDRKNLSDLLSDYGEKKNYEFTITEYDSGEQLCEDQSALEACQLLFLDINMQGMDGLKTAMRIKEKYPKLPVVLVTAYMNYALDGYKVKASRFLLKDNLADTIEECMDDLIAEINKNRRILEFRFVEGTIKLYADDIIYIGYGIRAGTSKFSCKYEVHHKNQRLCDDTYHGKKDSGSQGTICTGEEGIYAV